MRATVWIIGLVLVLFGSSAFAAGGSGNKSSNIKNKKSKCVQPASKYGGQCDRSNNGHGNNKDDVDSSNPGKSKKGKDTDPSIDDETKPSK